MQTPDTPMNPQLNSPNRDLAAESAELIARANALPGVADVLRIYGEHQKTLAIANQYQPQSLTTSTTGNRTV